MPGEEFKTEVVADEMKDVSSAFCALEEAILLDRRNCALHCVTAVSVLLWLLLSGCADRDEAEEARRQQAPGYNAEANEALKRAEKAMMEAGIEVNFSELSGLESLTDLHTILPKPGQVRQLEKQQKMEEAIEALYSALNALAKSGVAQAPTRLLAETGGSRIVGFEEELGASNSDLALIHLHISYCYVLAAVSRLARFGLGPDGIPDTADDLYYISFPEKPDVENLEVYKFTLTDRGQALMDSVDPGIDPHGYIKVFYDEGQVEALQVIIDSLLLLVGAEVAVVENPAAGIKAHEPEVNRQIYRRDALYHLDQALGLAMRIAPELEDAISEFDETVIEYFSRGILEDTIEWGLEIRKIPDRYKSLLR
jgi:hypothetical protein